MGITPIYAREKFYLLAHEAVYASDEPNAPIVKGANMITIHTDEKGTKRIAFASEAGKEQLKRRLIWLLNLSPERIHVYETHGVMKNKLRKAFTTFREWYGRHEDAHDWSDYIDNILRPMGRYKGDRG